MVHEAVVFLVDVVHDGAFPKADEKGVEVPVDGRSGTPLLEDRGLLSLTRKAKHRVKEAVIWSRVELGDNRNVGQYLWLKMMWSISLWMWEVHMFVGRKASGSVSLHGWFLPI
ncbi:unnamed protein product [Heligmosomoides polygyrus]|uniref:Uncharacterized protein n=1 Tax=Heligmosomoides polygyrus TaxID=6339 RepID=A0A183F6Y7_HELPZ|nr:unnamed protein product [Heligmosomoides polygyrus]